MNLGIRSIICAQKQKAAPVVPASAEAGSDQNRTPASDSLRTISLTMSSTKACFQVRPAMISLTQSSRENQRISRHPKNLTLTPPPLISESSRMSHQNSTQFTRTSPRYRMSSSSSWPRWRRLTPSQRSRWNYRSPSMSITRKPRATSRCAKNSWRRNYNSSN